MPNYYSDLREIINLIKSPELQSELLPAKIVFIFFSIFFFVSVIYFMFNSTYLKYEFLIDMEAFFDWQPGGSQKIAKRWKKIQKKIEIGTDYEYKLAVIEADDLLKDVLEDRGFKGKTLEERIEKVEETQLPNADEVIEAHKTRNSIVYNPDYKLDRDQVKKILNVYEQAIKNIESF